MWEWESWEFLNYCVTKYPKLGYLEQQQFILSEFTRLEVQIEVLARLIPSRRPREESVHGLLLFLVLLETSCLAYLVHNLSNSSYDHLPTECQCLLKCSLLSMGVYPTDLSGTSHLICILLKSAKTLLISLHYRYERLDSKCLSGDHSTQQTIPELASCREGRGWT